MRVRCVNDTGVVHKHPRLTRGKEYDATEPFSTVGNSFVKIVDDAGIKSAWLVDRFKPVVRVKATCVPSLSVLVMRARMTPEQQQAMQVAQRESWVRGEMALSKAERDQTRRSAPRS